MTTTEVNKIWEDIIDESEVLSLLTISKSTLKRYRKNGLIVYGKDYFSAMGKRFVYSKEGILKLLKVNIKK